MNQSRLSRGLCATEFSFISLIRGAKLFLATAAFFVAACANAIPITWQFQNAVFNDGGTITGSFAYDRATDIMSSVAVTTTAGSAMSGTTYDSDLFPVGVWLGTVFGFLNSSDGPDYTGDSALAIFVAGTLTDLGGTFNILVSAPLISQEATCVQSACSTATRPFRVPISGFLTSNIVPGPGPIPGPVPGPVPVDIPVPATVWLIGFGLLGLFGMVKRMKA